MEFKKSFFFNTRPFFETIELLKIFHNFVQIGEGVSPIMEKASIRDLV